MKEALPNIDFADSSFNYFKSWDCKEIEIKFSNIIRLKYEIGDFISNVYELSDDDCRKYLINESERLGSETSSYKLFQILDIYDFPVFEVIAEKINASIKNLESH